MLRIAFPTDEHVPFQDDRAREVALKLTSDFDPHWRISGSDGLDFYNLSRYDKNPDRIQESLLQLEIDTWQRCQREWRDASPNAAVFWLLGNHENRLIRYLWRNAEMHGLRALQFNHLLEFDKLGIAWHENGESCHRELELFGRLIIRHGDVVRQHAAYSARAMMERNHSARTVVHGHTHRGGTYMVTTRDGVVQAQEGFCLCRLDPEYVEHPNWQQGIVLIEASEELISIEAVPFHRSTGKVVARWRGKEYRSA